MARRAGVTRPGHLPPAGEPGDRRVVTALFADLVDYVRLVAEHDPEDVRRRVDAALMAMVESIEAFGGTREKFIGDAIFAVFGWPRGHDDDALRAAHCALAIREALARVDAPAIGEPLEIRIGLATGEVVAAPRGDDGWLDWSLTGPAVTTAARIQGIAQPGEILLDEATLRATRKALDVEDRGPQLLRGQTRPIRIVRLLGQAGFQPWHPPTGRLVGRDAELGRLRRRLLALAEGLGGVAIVEGDPGMGKSRLLAELASDARTAGLALTWVDNVSYGVNEPYRFGRALAQAFADEHGTDSGSLARRLLFTPDAPHEEAQVWAGAIAAMARDAAFSGWEEETPLVPNEPAAVADAIRRLAVRYMERLIEVSGPRVVVADDLHWLDPSSAGMVDELVRLTERLPLLILFGSRADVPPPVASLEGAERIDLRGLDRDETRELAGSMLRRPVDPAEAQRLHDRTGGNPLFITETVRAALEDRAQDSAGRRILDESSLASDLPITLRSLLGARVDALPDDARTVVRVASVVGMSFDESVVGEVLGQEVEPAIYARLAEASLIVPLEAPARWRFGHPLIHDAAYGGLLGTTRRALHTKVADLLQARSGPEAIGVVARHRMAARDVERAVPLLVEAAEKALAVGATAEAAGFWNAAAELTSGTPPAEVYRQRARDALEAIPAAGSASN
ncbi:MAG TPA: adenylate/guanylate cyclase domain-containing protein [Candidatus Limnocylindrales bacterium]|nr:adenylate/guanylate cyclase domain-containing protein [Candidatus Limnocylindrales bacterium]